MATLPCFATSQKKKLHPCSCRQLQAFSFQHLPAGPSEYCMCEVSAARNVLKHVYAALFVCCNRLNDQWVEVAGDLRTLIRNLWSAKMFGLQGAGIGSCRTGRPACRGLEEGACVSGERRADCRRAAEMPEIFTVDDWQRLPCRAADHSWFMHSVLCTVRNYNSNKV